jgi:2-polyprenyl-3-methyl-5-hydroxy-6-metoxy-1,4-benzoquinol methylase
MLFGSQVRAGVQMSAGTASEERAFWNEWNKTREATQGRVSREQQQVVLGWLDALGRRDLDLIDIGCGAGWLCEKLTPYGRVVGTDLSDEVLARMALRLPSAKFVAGDFMQLDFGREAFDVAISLEVLSHVPDQPAFMAKVASLIRPGGSLMMATQNRPVLMKNTVTPAGPGQLRRWVNQDEYRQLLAAHFDIQELFSITPKYNRGPLKLVTSEKVHEALRRVGLGGPLNQMIRAQEKAGMGWTLMALARKR